MCLGNTVVVVFLIYEIYVVFLKQEFVIVRSSNSKTGQGPGREISLLSVHGSVTVKCGL